jgi:hypothetical protein
LAPAASERCTEKLYWKYICRAAAEISLSNERKLFFNNKEAQSKSELVSTVVVAVDVVVDDVVVVVHLINEISFNELYF